MRLPGVLDGAAFHVFRRLQSKTAEGAEKHQMKGGFGDAMPMQILCRAAEPESNARCYSLKARPGFHKPLYPGSSPGSTSNKNDEKEKNHVRY